MRIIAYKQNNGSLGIINAFKCDDVNLFLQKIGISNSVYKILDGTEQIDHEFFDAHEMTDAAEITVNILKAKEIQKNKWRARRILILKQLDVDYMRAVERGDTAAQQKIASKKQQLRDITLIELPDSLEGIKSVLPEALSAYSQNYDENGVEIVQ
jgi:hypothetical protein